MCLDHNDAVEDSYLSTLRVIDDILQEDKTEPLDIPIAKNFKELLQISQLLYDYQLLREAPKFYKDYASKMVYGTLGNNYTPALIQDYHDRDLFDRFYAKR